MSVVVVTGAAGLIGSEATRHFAGLGFDIVGIENDQRARFFGPEASTRPNSDKLVGDLGDAFHPVDVDIRDRDGINRLFEKHGRDVAAVIHTAAQPSHDWAAKDPHTDFGVNAVGTLNLLEATRASCPDVPFIFTSTNKVYGDTPNYLPLVETATRLELPTDHEFFSGVTTDMTIDRSTHSLFGVSKVAADLLVQEYGRYFGMATVCFRGGCLTGPQHAGTQLHGFLSYLMRCAVTGDAYTIFGHGGKQVRDNIHSHDVLTAFERFFRAPRSAAVYNLGGGRDSNVSMLEAIAICEEISGNRLDWTLSEDSRVGDHRWWVSDLDAFRTDYPGWTLEYGIREILRQIHEANIDHWANG